VAAVFGLAPLVANAKWTAKGEAGLVSARGNTHTDSANAKFDIADELEQWKHSVGFSGVYAADVLGTTTQRWEVHQQSDYKYTVKTFAFESLRYEDDRFSGFEYQSTVALGIGHHFIDTEKTKLDAQIGAGYKVFRTRDSFAADGVTIVPGERKNGAVAQAGVNFERVLTATTKITDKFLTEAGSDNTSVQNELSLQVKINASFALAAGYSVHYNTDPPEGFKSTDTLTTINLVYELK
jgi:putative salt-induced outer membrane protein